MELQFFTLPKIPGLNFAFIFNSTSLAIVLMIFFAAYVLVSFVLVYHWRAFGMKNQSIMVAESLFIFISAVLFVMASLGVYYF